MEEGESKNWRRRKREGRALLSYAEEASEDAFGKTSSRVPFVGVVESLSFLDCYKGLAMVPQSRKNILGI